MGKTVSKERFAKRRYFSLYRPTIFLYPGAIASCPSKNLSKLDSTSSPSLCPLTLLLPDLAGTRAPFYQRRINGIVCEGESKTNRYYHYFQLLFFANFPFRVECTTAYLPWRVTIPSNGVIARSAPPLPITSSDYGNRNTSPK